MTKTNFCCLLSNIGRASISISISILVIFLTAFVTCDKKYSEIIFPTSDITKSAALSSSLFHNESDSKLEFQHADISDIFASHQMPSRLDRFFKKDSSIFEEYMRDVDLSLIPGLREEDDFENWIPPDDVQRELPSYLSGFDYENRPVWVVEYGKYNYTKFATSGRKRQKLFYKYSRYLSYTTLKSQALKSTTGHRVTQHVTIVDFEGLTPDHILDPKALQLQLRWIRDSRRFSNKYMARIILLNVNMLSETLFTLARSFLLSLLDRIEVYGTNKAKWRSQILKFIPADQLPEWYGGTKGFRPLYVHG